MLRGFVYVSDRLLGELGLANLTVGWQLIRSTWSDSIRRGLVVNLPCALHVHAQSSANAQIHDREWGFTCCDLHLLNQLLTDCVRPWCMHACPILRGAASPDSLEQCF
jgi:hypothetical protein